MSILFADLVGFTSLAEGRDAEETRELLSRYFELSREIIERYGGTVEKFIGDAVMAVWGAPIARENDAERAVRAALDLVATIPSIGPGLQARAGVLTGEAAVTLGATNQGMVAGDLVNTASRLQSVAPPGTVLVGESTERSASSAIVFEAVGPQQLKGKEAPVAAYRALRVVAERGGRGRSDRLEAPFVGRDDEFRLIKELVHATGKERRPRIVSITGVAGVGKSRLSWELNKYLDGIAETVFWHTGRSPAYGEGIAFWALGEMVRSRAGLIETDDEPTTRAKIRESVARWVPLENERAWIEGALLALLGIETGASNSREELFSAWRTFFERIAEQGTAILVFEDLHWADPGQLDFIDHLLDWSRGVPLLIVTLSRPELLERRPTWGAGRRNFVALDLEPLSDAAMRQLLEGLVAGLPETVVRSIVARADGIPLYAVETVRMLVAEGRLAEVDGAYRLVAEIETLAIPETLQALIAARLDALEPADRSVLQDAAVLGQSFVVGGLAAVTGLDEATLEGHLRTLARRELVTREMDPRSAERGQYAFVQALIREVAYGTLAKRDRRSRHLAAARYFESLGEEELAGALAAHYLAAYRASTGDEEAQALAAQARIALKAAAVRSASLGSHEQAAGYLVEAIEVTSDAAEAAELRERAGSAFSQAANVEAADLHLRAALDAHRAVGDRPGTARATGLLGQALVNGWRRAEAVELLTPAIAEFADLGDSAMSLLEHQLARAHWFLGDEPKAIELSSRALERAEQVDDVAQIADVIISKGSLISMAGQYHEGLALLDAGVRIAEEHNLAATEARGLLNISATSVGRDPVMALGYAKRAYLLARRLGLRAQLDAAAGNSLEGAARVGDWEWVDVEGGRLLEEQLGEGQRQAILRGIEEVRAFRGEPVQDLLEEHARLMEGAEPSVVSNYHGGLGSIRLAEGRYAEASAAYEVAATTDVINSVTDMPKAARMALWAGDRAQVERLMGRLVELRAHGPAPDSSLTALRAALAGLDGRREESLALFTDALARWSAAGLPIDRAFTAIDMLVVLGPDEPAARAAAEEARGTFISLGAKALLDILDRAMSGTPMTATPSAASTNGSSGVPIAETAEA